MPPRKKASRSRSEALKRTRALWQEEYEEQVLLPIQPAVTTTTSTITDTTTTKTIVIATFIPPTTDTTTSTTIPDSSITNSNTITTNSINPSTSSIPGSNTFIRASTTTVSSKRKRNACLIKTPPKKVLKNRSNHVRNLSEVSSDSESSSNLSNADSDLGEDLSDELLNGYSSNPDERRLSTNGKKRAKKVHSSDKLKIFDFEKFDYNTERVSDDSSGDEVLISAMQNLYANKGTYQNMKAVESVVDNAEPAVMVEDIQESPARKRVKLSNDLEDVEVMGPEKETIMSQVGELTKLMKRSQFICYRCDSKNVEVRTTQTERHVFVRRLETYCRKCKKTITDQPVSTSPYVTLPDGLQSKQSHETSIRLVLGMIVTGVGHTKCSELLSALNIVPLSKSEYARQVKNACILYNDKAERMKNFVASKVISYYQSKGRELSEGCMNIAVSFDSSWETRGHSSLICVVAAIECETGLILDFEVISKFCFGCSCQKKKLKPDAFKVWYEGHKPKCEMNYDPSKSSGSLEANGAKILFRRSIKRNLRYTSMISDQDSSTYKVLLDDCPYGPKYVIQKVNCLDHFGKKVYKQLDEERVKLGLDKGAGDGKLTKKMMDAFSKFYCVAVKRYAGNHEKIRDSVFASVFHHAATDEKQTHHLCKKSWCKYRQQKDKGLPIQPGWHKDKKNRPFSLNKTCAKAVLGIMANMTTDKFLSRITGQTQNINESLHSKIWGKLPTTEFHGHNQVQLACNHIVLEHNFGVKKSYILGSYTSLEKEVHKTLGENENKRVQITPKRYSSRKRKQTKGSPDYNPGARYPSRKRKQTKGSPDYNPGARYPSRKRT